jgi:hypothetical protein
MSVGPPLKRHGSRRRLDPDKAVEYERAMKLGKHGGNHGNQHTPKGSPTTPMGRGRDYILARLDRDGHAELAAKVRAGEMSTYVAAIQLGWRRKPSPPPALTRILRLVPELSDEKHARIIARLTKPSPRPSRSRSKAGSLHD